MVGFLIKCEETISRVLLALCTILVVAASLGRWSGYPIIWSVDIAQLLFIWVCALGANQAMRRDQHVSVDLLLLKLPSRAREWVMVFHFVLIEAFLAAIAWYGLQLTLLNVERQFSDTPISYSWVTVAVPVMSVLLFFTVLVRIVRLVRGEAAVKPADPAEIRSISP
jgi:TRAP-type C4-dicarboxylate transport system permease small subunit